MTTSQKDYQTYPINNKFDFKIFDDNNIWYAIFDNYKEVRFEVSDAHLDFDNKLDLVVDIINDKLTEYKF